MKRLKAWLLKPIKAFIVRTVIENYNANGDVRRTLKSEEFQAGAVFSKVAGRAVVRSPVRAGNAFPHQATQ